MIDASRQLKRVGLRISIRVEWWNSANGQLLTKTACSRAVCCLRRRLNGKSQGGMGWWCRMTLMNVFSKYEVTTYEALATDLRVTGVALNANRTRLM